jgi:hypothetical protein
MLKRIALLLRYRTLPALLLGALLVGASPLQAQQDVITVTLDKVEFLTLPRSASTMIVTKPEIVDVVLESPTYMFLLGKQPGETGLIILDSKRKEILSVTVVVTPEIDRHVTITRGGKSGTSEQTMSCGNGGRCTTVATPGADKAGGGGGGAPPPSSSGGLPPSSSSGSSGNSPVDDAITELNGER